MQAHLSHLPSMEGLINIDCYETNWGRVADDKHYLLSESPVNLAKVGHCKVSEHVNSIKDILFLCTISAYQ